MKHLLLVPSLLLAAIVAHGAPPATDSPAASAEPADAAERQTVIGILHTSDIEDGADEIRLHHVSSSDGAEGAFVVDIGLESRLSRKHVELMKRRVRQAGEDKVRRILLKLTAQVDGEHGEQETITRGRIMGFKAMKDAEIAGGAREETLVGEWPDLGFIKFPPSDKEGADAKEAGFTNKGQVRK